MINPVDKLHQESLKKIAGILEIQHQRFEAINKMIGLLNERLDIISERIDKLEDSTNGRA